MKEKTEVPSSKEKPEDDGGKKKTGQEDVESLLEAKAEQAITLNQQLHQGTTTRSTTVEPGAIAVHGVGISDEATVGTGDTTRAAARPPSSQLAVVQSVDAHVVNDDAFELAVQEKVLQRFQTAETANIVEIIPDKKKSDSVEDDQVKRSSRMLSCVFIVGTICFAVTLAIMLTYGKNDKMSSSESGVGGQNGGSGGTPSSSVFQKMYDTLVTVSGEDVFLDMSSPQFKALDWISYEDDFDYDFDEDGDDNSETLLKERYVLALLYFATGGDNWNKDIGFLSTSNVCNWNEASTGATNGTSISADVDTLTLGVRCNGDGSVVDISLVHNNLNGTLPSEISALTSLEGFSVYENDLYGTIPESWGNLTRLRNLNLGLCHFTGSIPSTFTNLTKFIEFQMDSNQFTGTLPNWEEWDSMKRIDVQSNLFTGTIPEFPADHRLDFFSASFNLLTGPVPSSIYSETIEHIGFWNNEMSGTIASEIGISEKLQWLDFESNSLTGSIPTEVGMLSNIQNLYFSYNKLSSTIPSEFGLTTRLQQLWFNNNQLTGTVPSELSELFATLEWLTVQGNNLTGTMDAFCEVPTSVWTIEADCGGDDPEIDCPCCITCCDDISGNCTIDGVQACEVSKGYFAAPGGRHFVDGAGATCECSINENNEAVLSCTDTECQSCNRDGSVCSVNSDYSFTFYPESVFWRQAVYSFQYVEGLNDTVTFRTWSESEELASFNSCEVFVNGQKCNSCLWRTCLNVDGAWEVNCENVAGAGRVDVCDQEPEDTGPLTVFALQDISLLQGCPPRLIKL